MRRHIFFHLAIYLSVLILIGVGCQSSPAIISKGEPIMSITITSAAFSEGKSIPGKYTCDGEDVSPPLDWLGIPKGAQSLVLITDDPDAPVGTWVHWVIFNMPVSLNRIPEGISKSEVIEGIGTQGRNDSHKIGYNGPCPPKGKPHRYFFKLYALDATLDLMAGASKIDVEKAMKSHILAQGQLIGTYSR
jgi:Raf kinase inhibitor-like YbhB/YbcL family protein